MAYFDGLVDASFKKSAAGKNVFYPWGIFGSGLVIDSDDKYLKLRSTLKISYIIFLTTIILFQTILGVKFSLAMLIAYYVWYFTWLKKETSMLEKSDEKLTSKEVLRNSARSHNLITIIVLEIFSLLFVVGGLWMILARSNFLGYLVLIFFGFCLFQITRLLIEKLRQK